MITEPLNVNLIMSKEDMNVGGNPNNIISEINNKIYTHLVYHSNSNSNSNSDKLSKLKFKFINELNLQNTTNSRYLGKGGITAVFSVGLDNIENFDEIKNHFPPKMLEQTDLIMRVENDDCMDFSHFISVWKRDKKLFPSNIIDVYAYGYILTPDEILLGKYIITKRYNDYKKILKLGYDDSISLIKSMCEFMSLLQSHNIIYRDLKIHNIGFDYVDSQITFIVLDYDTFTLLRQKDIFFNQSQIKYCSESCAGTYIPYYVMHNYLYNFSQWKNQLDKLYSVGLFNVILALFYDTNPSVFSSNTYKPNIEMKKIYQILNYIWVDFNYEDTSTIYDNAMIKYNDEYKKISEQISQLNSKYSEIHYGSELDNELKKILLNLISRTYKKIYYPNQIKLMLFNVFKLNSTKNTSGYDSDHSSGTTDSSKSINTLETNIRKDSIQSISNISSIINSTDSEESINASNELIDIVNKKNNSIKLSKLENSNVLNTLNKLNIPNIQSKLPKLNNNTKLIELDKHNDKYKEKYIKYKQKYIWLKKLNK